MSDWKCSGCGTHYPLTVTKCECEKAKPMQIGDGTRVRIPEPSCPVKGGLCNCTGACRGDTVHSASWVLPQFNGQVSCNVAGCDCGTNGTPLHQRVIAEENRRTFIKGACSSCLLEMIKQESEGDVFDPTYVQCENPDCKWHKFVEQGDSDIKKCVPPYHYVGCTCDTLRATVDDMGRVTCHE